MLATPEPITRAISQSKAHPTAQAQRITGTNKGGGDPKQGLLRNKHLVQAPHRAVPAMGSSSPDHLSDSGRTCCVKGWDTLWAARESLGWHRTSFGMFREEPKAGQGRGVGDLGSNRSREIEGQGAKKDWSLVRRWLVNALAWPFPAPHQLSLSYLPLKFLLGSVLG